MAVDSRAVRYAHSLAGRPREAWERLEDHLAAVGRGAAQRAAAFSFESAGLALGLMHDIGKASDDFLRYISQAPGEGAARGPDHSTAGAREAVAHYGQVTGRLLAYALAGHHAGLADARSLEDRLSDGYALPAYGGWRRFTGDLPTVSLPAGFRPSRHKGFSAAFLTRMLFSCLVDADFVETERFYAEADGKAVERGSHRSLEELNRRLEAFMAGKRGGRGKVNRLRDEILEHALARAGETPGLFTLTVPTGGGKTLASLSFALEHALRHGLRRVIYVIPFTSIIEQTAGVFREALASEEDILEHHASFDWDKPTERDDEEGRDGLAKLRRAAENWDAPIVVTTAVQFYESLFAARGSRCRKLHNIAGSVIVLDEAQTLPAGLLKPCLAALEELTLNYRSSVVVCTATQPAWRRCDGALAGAALPISPERELAPDPPRLYEALRRVTVERRGRTEDAEIAARFAAQPALLCIVNSRRHARRLFEAIRHLPGARHLSTYMYPAHRRAILAEVKADLQAGRPARLVATSLIEAGVDVDFPEVWRAAAGLESIAQAAGRCNREGRLESGRVVVFDPVDDKPPQEMKQFQQAARMVMDGGLNDLLGLEAIRSYFAELYWQKGEEALDATLIGERPGILAALADGGSRCRFPFRSIADAFRLIEDATEPVIVARCDKAALLLKEIAASERPLRGQLRKLQLYTVALPCRLHATWLAQGLLIPIHPALKSGLAALADLSLYRKETGIEAAPQPLRDAVDNIL